MRKKLKILILVTILILIGGFIFISKKQSPPPSFPIINVEEKVEDHAILEINNIKYETKIFSQISVYDFMEKLKNESKIDFKEKTYLGMGKFINEINGIKNNGEKNWIYYVNGEKANIGVSNYKINIGDIVSWKYENEKSY